MLLFLAPIGLQRRVIEMTLHPRPASLRLTTAVETDHPRMLLSNSSTRSAFNAGNAVDSLVYNATAARAIPLLCNELRILLRSKNPYLFWILHVDVL